MWIIIIQGHGLLEYVDLNVKEYAGEKFLISFYFTYFIANSHFIRFIFVIAQLLWKPYSAQLEFV